ncbi:hypothetical protein OESDEN_04607 [Oesophagostomum dentatum]|uniref:Uncharacterized protein n=1 Tax=Oesophagostomum dentatum TaxID=61180 RepID=A0A0B1TJ57_OESDE|nr:hypothetical protein OESDEN_04607 [Oesophagostomum dentatum]
MVNYLFNNESEDEMEQKPQLQPFKIRSSFSHVATQVNSCTKRKCMKDAATSIDKPPGEETLDAYFSDHPFLDFAGRCGSIGIVAILLYTIYVWCANLLQCTKG